MHEIASDKALTIKVIKAQLAMYEDIGGRDSNALSLYSNYDKEVVDISGCFTKNEESLVVNFGVKHKGQNK